MFLVDRGRRGGVSVAGVAPRGAEPSLRRRGGIPPPGVSINPPPVQENGKSNEEEEEEEQKEEEEEDTIAEDTVNENKPSIHVENNTLVVVPVGSLPDPEPDTETETETETGEDIESENEPLPPPPPPLDSVADNEPLPPPPQITVSLFLSSTIVNIISQLKAGHRYFRPAKSFTEDCTDGG